MNVYTFISWQRVGLVEKNVLMSSSRLAYVWVNLMRIDNVSYIVLVDGIPLVWDVNNVE